MAFAVYLCSGGITHRQSVVIISQRAISGKNVTQKSKDECFLFLPLDRSKTKKTRSSEQNRSLLRKKLIQL